MADASQLEWLEHFKIERDAVTSSSRRRQVDNWVRGNMIGTGAFSEVYVESNCKTNKFRAVKEIRKRSNRQDLKSELLALTRLSRPANEEYFVQFLGWYDDQWSLYLIMEYFELGDLRKHMDSPLPELQARDIALQLFLCLHAMHKDGFAHRDLKPDNIFVVSKNPWHIKIGDFGVSKRVLDNETFLRTLQIGTRSYMAPEVLELLPQEFESSTYNNTVDIWAGGIIIYELLCAAKPFFRSRSLSQYCFGQRELPTTALRSQGVSEAGVALIKRLLQVVPSDRPDADIVLEAEWFDMENHEISKMKHMSSASASAKSVTVSSASSVALASPLSFLEELGLNNQRTSKIENLQGEEEPMAWQENLQNSGYQAVVGRIAGFIGTPRQTPGMEIPATIPPSAMVQHQDFNNLNVNRGSPFLQESMEELDAIDIEGTLVPWKESERIPPSLRKSAPSKFDVEMADAPFSPWRQYPLKFLGNISIGQHQTLRRFAAAACVSDGNVAFVIGGKLSRDQETEQAWDTWRLTISNKYMLCTPVEARKLPNSDKHAAVMTSNNTLSIVSELSSVRKVLVLDQLNGEWREYHESIVDDTTIDWQVSMVGNVMVALRMVFKKTWPGVLEDRSGDIWYFEIYTMDLTRSRPFARWHRSVRHLMAKQPSPWQYSMVTYRQSVIFLIDSIVWQFDTDAKTLRGLPMRHLGRYYDSCATALIGDWMYIHRGFIASRRGGLHNDLVALHIPTRTWRRLKEHVPIQVHLWRTGFAMLAMGTRLVVFGGSHRYAEADYAVQPSGDFAECVWVLDTAEHFEWEDILG